MGRKSHFRCPHMSFGIDPQRFPLLSGQWWVIGKICPFLFAQILHKFAHILHTFANKIALILHTFSLADGSNVEKLIVDTGLIASMFSPQWPCLIFALLSHYTMQKRGTHFITSKASLWWKNLFSSTGNKICLFVYSRFPDIVPLWVKEWWLFFLFFAITPQQKSTCLCLPCVD